MARCPDTPAQPERVDPITAKPTTPVTLPIMLQGWHDLTSIHWRFEPEVVQALLPAGFTVDTFDGSAWVGLIPFSMRRIRIPHLPAFGRLSTFPETNVRTYIVNPSGERGVWFFSLDITRLVTALVARVSYRLPYCWAAMTIEHDHAHNTVSYTSRRRWPQRSSRASTNIEVVIGQPIDPDDVTDLEHFLSARWALGTAFGRRLMWADVDHPRWPLYRATLSTCQESLVAAAGLHAPDGEAMVLWSPGVDVRIALPRRAESNSAPKPHRDR